MDDSKKTKGASDESKSSKPKNQYTKPYKIFYTMLHNQAKMVIVKTSQEEQNYHLCKNVLVTGQEEAVDNIMLGVNIDPCNIMLGVNIDPGKI